MQSKLFACSEWVTFIVSECIFNLFAQKTLAYLLLKRSLNTAPFKRSIITGCISLVIANNLYIPPRTKLDILHTPEVARKVSTAFYAQAWYLIKMVILNLIKIT